MTTSAPFDPFTLASKKILVEFHERHEWEQNEEAFEDSFSLLIMNNRKRLIYKSQFSPKQISLYK